MRLLLTLVSAFLVSQLCSACSDHTHHIPSQISIDTNPEGATCLLRQGGDIIAKVDATPGTATTTYINDNITIECSKKGYHTALFDNHYPSEKGFFSRIFNSGADTQPLSGDDSYHITLVPAAKNAN